MLRLRPGIGALVGSTENPPMSKIFLRRHLSSLVPVDELGEEVLKKFKLNSVIKAEITKPRSYKHHCLAFALLNLTYNNQERYANFEMFRKAVAIEAGHVEELIGLDGAIYLQARSLNYDTLDELEFSKVMAEMMAVCAKILDGIGVDELAGEVSRYASSRYGVAA